MANWSTRVRPSVSSQHSQLVSPGTQLTMRTFHIGGAASRTAAASTVDKSAGTANFAGAMRYVKNAAGDKIVIARSAEVVISTATVSASVTRFRTAPNCSSKTARQSRLARCSPMGCDFASDSHRVQGRVKFERAGRRHRRQTDRRRDRHFHARRDRRQAPRRLAVRASVRS